MRDTKHLGKHANKLAQEAKEKALFRTQRKAVEAGAHGTLDYTIKEGVNKNKKAARCEIRFPDAAGNPYLTFSAMLMAGLDGIKNKINPGKPVDEDLYAMPENEVKNIPTVCGSLREAMENLDRDRKFLTQGGVFTDDQIDAYIALKFEEIYKLEHTPHPMEFEMYYSC